MVKELLLFVAAILVIAMLAGAQDGLATKPSTQVESDKDIIATLEQYTATKDIRGIESLQKRVEELRDREPLRYIGLALQVCNRLVTFDFGSPKQYGLASTYALSALDVVNDQVPIIQHLELASRLQPEAIRAAGTRTSESRAKYMAAWTRAVKRLNQEASEPLVPGDEPSPNEVLPGFEGVLPFAGASPSTIQDTERRRQYQEAMEARHQRSQHFLNVSLARQRRDLYLGRFRSFVVVIYRGEKPELVKKELAAYLPATGMEEAAQRELLAAVLRPTEP